MARAPRRDRTRRRLPPLLGRAASSFVLACAFWSAGCGGAGRHSMTTSAAGSAPAPMEAAEAPADAYYSFDESSDKSHADREQAPPPSPRPEGGEIAPEEQAATDQSRAPLLIYDATLTLAVFETAKHIDAIQEMARDAGGYLVHRSDRQITVRVPADSFAVTLERMAKDGDELGREVRVKDVTGEFTDLEIRLQNARAVRARLEELLAKATKVEEALAVERELERVAREIELMVGRLKLLRELVQFSTITVLFEARPVDQVQSRTSLPFPWLHELGLPNLLSL